MASASESERPFELEGVVTALNVLRLRSGDLGAIATALARRIAKTPGMFRGAPVVVDLNALEPEPPAKDAGLFPLQPTKTVLPFELAALLTVLREKGLVPVGVSARGSQWLQQATAAGLGVIELDRTPPPRKPKPAAGTAVPASTAADADEDSMATLVDVVPVQPAKTRTPTDQPAPRPVAKTRTPADQPSPVATTSSTPPGPQFALTLTQPLRSGQVVYAEGRDAVALAAVHAGAELMADGNIHVYGPLRGRALAGATGSEDARIFCQHLDADLISIAGVYLHSDALPADKRGKPVQVSLQNGQLVLTDLSAR
jgi:septum site-determining protein MinC